MKAKRILKKLNYLPRWAWYLASLSVGFFIGPVVVYCVFHALEKMAAEQEAEDSETLFDWNVDVDEDGVHVHRRGKASPRSSSGYRDEECIVTGEDEADVLRQWKRTEQSARSAGMPKQEEDEKPFTSDALEDVVRDVQSAICRINRANELIPGEELSARLASIENSCSQILSILEQRPQLLPELRSFLRYYLPTTLKLLDARVRLENNASTPKAREVRARISEALGVIDKAFLKQVAALDEYRFIDLESEMDVLRDMLRADGFADEDESAAIPPRQQEKAPVYDPFEDVMQRRREKKGGGTPLAGH